MKVDRDAGRVALEAGYRLDLGGIAKGWAADRVLASLADWGPALVNAGGDIAATGAAWPVGVETPAGTLTLELTQGADRTAELRDGAACVSLPREGGMHEVIVVLG